MAKTYPFHSKKPETKVYHDDTACTEGNNIESYNKVPGTGNRPRCKRCSELSR